MFENVTGAAVRAKVSQILGSLKSGHTDRQTDRGQNPQTASALTQEMLIPWDGLAAPSTPINEIMGIGMKK